MKAPSRYGHSGDIAGGFLHMDPRSPYVDSWSSLDRTQRGTNTVNVAIVTGTNHGIIAYPMGTALMQSWAGRDGEPDV